MSTGESPNEIFALQQSGRGSAQSHTEQLGQSEWPFHNSGGWGQGRGDCGLGRSVQDGKEQPDHGDPEQTDLSRWLRFIVKY